MAQTQTHCDLVEGNPDVRENVEERHLCAQHICIGFSFRLPSGIYMKRIGFSVSSF